MTTGHDDGVPRSISGSTRVPPTRVTWSEELNKRVRTGTWSEQAVSTTTRIHESIDTGDWEVAAQLIDYWMEEAKVVHVIYQVWTDGFVAYLRGRGLDQDSVDAEIERLKRLLALPDGTAFDPARGWSDMAVRAGSLAHGLRGFERTTEEAHRGMETLRETWRRLHDRGADLQMGLLTFVATTFGEAAIEDAYANVLAPYLAERYQPFDVRERPFEETFFRNVYLTVEAMRGHLCGPERNGDLQVAEDDEKVVVSFDPCGSGNRAIRGDAVEGTPSRMLPPYNFGVTTQEHDWAWNKTGINYYCAHCCYALEYWPAKQWGHPLRVVDPPRFPEDAGGDSPKKCSWTIYKSLEAIPPSAYERIGMVKPSDSADHLEPRSAGR